MSWRPPSGPTQSPARAAPRGRAAGRAGPTPRSASTVRLGDDPGRPRAHAARRHPDRQPRRPLPDRRAGRDGRDARPAHPAPTARRADVHARAGPSRTDHPPPPGIGTPEPGGAPPPRRSAGPGPDHHPLPTQPEGPTAGTAPIPAPITRPPNQPPPSSVWPGAPLTDAHVVACLTPQPDRRGHRRRHRHVGDAARRRSSPTPPRSLPRLPAAHGRKPLGAGQVLVAHAGLSRPVGARRFARRCSTTPRPDRPGRGAPPPLTC